jgi:hypothetical protein
VIFELPLWSIKALLKRGQADLIKVLNAAFVRQVAILCTTQRLRISTASGQPSACELHKTQLDKV